MTNRPRWMTSRIVLSLLFIASFLGCLWGGPLGGIVGWERAIAQPAGIQASPSTPSSASEQVRNGVASYREGRFREAIAQWQQALAQYEASGNLGNQAIVLENLARAYRRMGDSQGALPYWEQVAAVYQHLGDRPKEGRMLTEQAQTLTRLGQYRQAIALLCGADQGCSPTSAVGIARAAEDALGEAAALGSLGEAYRLQGSLDRALGVLEVSQAIAQSLENQQYLSAAFNGLGSVYAQMAQVSDRRANDALERGDTSDSEQLQQAARQKNEQALTSFQQSVAAASATNDQHAQLRALLNMIPLYHSLGFITDAEGAYRDALSLLNSLPPSRDKAYAKIDLANLLLLTRSPDMPRDPLSGTTCFKPEVKAQISAARQEIESFLRGAIATARQVSDSRAQSFALGQLGHLYECVGDYRDALAFTNDAEFAADQDLNARDSLYLWQWQTGRILKQQGKIQDAIRAYEEAIATLEKIRSDILSADRDIQFDFRDAVEPVYRQLAELRLSQAPISEIVAPAENDDEAENIGAALTAIDSLKLAELENYFGDECVILASADIDETQAAVDARYPQTGIFSTFILDDRTAIILTLPGGKQRIEWLEVSQDILSQQVNRFRIRLEESSYTLADYDSTQGTPLYDELIRPFISDLEQAGVHTLVFVQDGIFRSVPMAALYDGERYLIESYAIATTPSLSLTPVGPPTQRRSLRALALGLDQPATVDGQTFQALNAVSDEITQIKVQLPGSQSLLNEDFTRDRLRQALQDSEFSIIHLATHGEFGAEPEDTFLVTGDAQKLTIGELESAIRQGGGTRQVDLLTLTACKTGIGDNRAALGLAGVAVQAGARSAVASLWAINDASTAEIIGDFYQALNNPELNKAQALQTAQISLLKRRGRISNPGFWAPFILIGDWR